MSVQVQACARAEEMMRCALNKHIRTLDNLWIKNGLHKNVFFSFFFLLFSCIYIHVCTVLLSHSHLVLKMLTNAIIKWGGNLGEGRTRTLNWTREERKVNERETGAARVWKNKRSNRWNYNEEKKMYNQWI